MVKQPQILVVDETTTALSQKGRELLYELMHHLNGQGKAVVFISHDLDEIKTVCDTLTVLRDGKIITHFSKENFNDDAIKTSMIGREMQGDYYRADNELSWQEKVLLRAGHLTGSGLNDVSLDLHAGEILGVGGLSECSMHTLGKALFGSAPLVQGTVETEGRTFSDPRQATRLGIGYVSKERDTESLCQQASIRDNIAIGGLHHIRKKRLILKKREITLPLDQFYILEVTGQKDYIELLIFQFWNAKDGVKTEKVVTLTIEKDNQQWYCGLLPLPDLDLDYLMFHDGTHSINVRSVDTAIKSTLLDLLFISESAGSRLQTVTIILGSAVLLLIITLILSAVWAFKGRTRKASVTLLVLLGVLFILIHLSHNFLPAQGGFLAVFKGLATTTLLMECLLCTLQNKCRRNYLMLVGFVCYIINDVLINYNLRSGMVASLAGNIFFIIGFLSSRKELSWSKAWAGVAAFAGGLTVLLLHRGDAAVSPYLPEMIVFLTVLCCFLGTGANQGHLIHIGTILLVLSNVFIFYNLVAGETWWSYIISLGTYYAAMISLALGTKDDVKLPKFSPRALRKFEKRHTKKEARSTGE